MNSAPRRLGKLFLIAAILSTSALTLQVLPGQLRVCLLLRDLKSTDTNKRALALESLCRLDPRSLRLQANGLRGSLATYVQALDNASRRWEGEDIAAFIAI